MESSLRAYRQAQRAYLDFMSPRVRPAGMDKYGPLYRMVAKAPFDIFGLMADGRFVGCEVKASRRKTSLAIVGPGSHGEGLQYHQLDALSVVARASGLAFVVWNNEGEIGMLSAEKIITAWTVYEAVLKASPKQEVPVGTKSIKWERFSPVKFEFSLGKEPYIDWLIEGAGDETQTRERVRTAEAGEDQGPAPGPEEVVGDGWHGDVDASSARLDDPDNLEMKE